MNRTIIIFCLSIFVALGIGYKVGKQVTSLRYQNISLTGDRLVDAAYTARTLRSLNEGNAEAAKDWLNYQLSSQALTLYQLLDSCPDERSRRHILGLIAGIANITKSAPLKAAYPEAQTELNRILKEAVETEKTFK